MSMSIFPRWRYRASITVVACSVRFKDFPRVVPDAQHVSTDRWRARVWGAPAEGRGWVRVGGLTFRKEARERPGCT